MRKLLLLMGLSMLGVLMFASVATAQEPGDVTIQSVRLGPGGSVIVSGTVECGEAGDYYEIGLAVYQRSTSNQYNWVYPYGAYGSCETSGTTSFTTYAAFGSGPFHKGPASVNWSSTIFDFDTGNTYTQSGVQNVSIR